MAISIGEFFDKFGGENLFLLGAFVICFVLISFILKRVMIFKDKITGKEDRTVPTIISLVSSLMIVYWVYKTEFSIGDFFSSIGIGSDILQVIIAIVIVIAIIYGFKKLKSLVFLILGAILIIISFTDWVYETETVFNSGLVSVGVWLLIKLFSPKNKHALSKDRED